MGVVANEPSMEDILSSIKRIIADGSDRAPAARNARRRPTAISDVIADDGAAADAADDEPAVLELTETVDDAAGDDDRVLAAAPQPAVRSPAVASKVEPPAIIEPPAPPAAVKVDETVPLPDAGILSDRSALAARQSLSHLSALLVRPEEGESNTLEGLVREMLRPMLKQWLDERLPELVEDMVKKEIDRITGRLG